MSTINPDFIMTPAMFADICVGSVPTSPAEYFKSQRENERGDNVLIASGAMDESERTMIFTGDLEDLTDALDKLVDDGYAHRFESDSLDDEPGTDLYVKVPHSETENREVVAQMMEIGLMTDKQGARLLKNLDLDRDEFFALPGSFEAYSFACGKRQERAMKATGFGKLVKP